MGPNGAGKSTLANVILNNPEYKKISGQIDFEGENINDLSTDKIAKKGIFMSRNPKLEEIHWFNKSPAKQRSILSEETPDLWITVLAVSFIILLSAFSQVFSPQNSSSNVWSKYLQRGPWASFGPTIEAQSKIVGGLSKTIVCLPIFFKKSSPIKN